MAVKLDLPSISGSGEAPLLLDANASFSIVVPQGGGHLWTERYAQKKQAFTPLETGTESTTHGGYYLVKEQNFRNIGGGFFEWDRLYANVPTSWEDTGQFAFNYTQRRTVITIGGDEPGIETFDTSKSLQVSAKITHSYQIGYPDTAAATSLADPIISAGVFVNAGTTVRPQEVEIYMGDIYVIKSYALLKGFNA